jgi:hypothetical protein
MKYLLIIIIISAAGQLKAQQIDTLSYNKAFNTQRISKGTFNYDSFLESNGTVTYTGRMKRSVIMQKDGMMAIAIEFSSINGDTVYSKGTSWVKNGTLVPIKNISKRGNMTITTMFAEDSIRLSLVDSAGNSRATSLKFSTDAFDFELDYESFAGLALMENGKYVIPFYQPGTRTQPKYYSYEIKGAETITVENKSYDCWILYSSSYQSGLCTFWIRKSDNIVIKEQRVRKDGTKSGKIIKLI